MLVWVLLPTESHYQKALVRFTHSFIASPLSDRIQPELFPAFQRASYSAGLLGDRANVKSITAFLETASWVLHLQLSMTWHQRKSAFCSRCFFVWNAWTVECWSWCITQWFRHRYDSHDNFFSWNSHGWCPPCAFMSTANISTLAQFALLKTALQENIETVSAQDLLSSYQMIAQAFSGCVRDQNFSIGTFATIPRFL